MNNISANKLIERDRKTVFDFYPSRNGQAAKMVEQGGIVTIIGKPGSVRVFDCNVMHRSNGNITH